MNAARALEPLRLQDDDLLDLLRPRNVAVALVLSAFFAVASLHNLGQPIILLVIGLGSIVAIFSPSTGFTLCVFLFAFRNEAFSIGPMKAADPLFAVTVASWTIHALLQNKLRLHYSMLIVALYMGAGILSGISAQWVSNYGMQAIRLTYLIVIYILALQMMGSRQMLLASVKAFSAAALVMATCSVIGFVSNYILHGNGVPFIDPVGRFGVQSIAVDPLRVSSFMIFPMLVMATLQQRARSGRERRIATLLFWFGMSACALSFSRSAVLQIGPALLVLWLLTGKHLAKIVGLVSVVAVFVLAVSFMQMDSAVVQKYGLSRWAVAGQLASSRTEPRETVGETGLKVFEAYPVFGLGLANFLPRYFEYRDPWTATGWLYSQQHSNNSAYLEAITETGLFGTCCLFVMLGYFCVLGRRVARQARRDNDPVRYLLAVAALGAFVAQVVAGIALELFSHNHVWIIMAILATLDSRRPARLELPTKAAPVAQTG